MVWESGCVVIVMLTPLSENGVRQCYHYWPDEGSNLYHVYEVYFPGWPPWAVGLGAMGCGGHWQACPVRSPATVP